tara:strand:+ start:437 stop:733 length:297 start_codon:yes stop_codon:yes gene_type:complete
MPPKIIISQLQRNVYNKISPKILSPDADSNFFVNEAEESGKIILKLRLLNKLSIEDMCHKLEMNKETYMNLEKGEIIPSKEVSTKLISIFNLKIENKL